MRWRSPPGPRRPATSIAQLGQLDNHGRWRFGRGTLGLTILIVGGLTLGLTALAVHLNVGIPGSDSTQIANLAKAAVGDGGLFGFFQLSSSVLLLAAAASSFQAGPGLLKALARTWPDGSPGLLPGPLARVNRHHTPVLAVVVYTAISAAIILAASGQEQELVLVYAVAVFVSFLAGLLAMARFSRRQGARVLLAINLIAAAVVAFTLVVNLGARLPLDLDRRDGADRTGSFTTAGCAPAARVASSQSSARLKPRTEAGGYCSARSR